MQNSRKITALVTGLGLVSLTACASVERGGVGTTFFSEAGSQTDLGTFGNATMNNMMVHTNAEAYMLDFAKRFSEQVPTTINFEFNRAELDAQAISVLRQQADWIRQFPEVRFRVYGHTDLVGSNAYNQRLGQRRANAAVNFLVSQGISRSRLEAVVSFGETRPIIQTQEPERQNRRTVTEVSGFVKSHPLVLDGKYAQIIYRDYVQSAVAPTTLTSAAESQTE